MPENDPVICVSRDNFPGISRSSEQAALFWPHDNGSLLYPYTRAWPASTRISTQDLSGTENLVVRGNKHLSASSRKRESSSSPGDRPSRRRRVGHTSKMIPSNASPYEGVPSSDDGMDFELLRPHTSLEPTTALGQPNHNRNYHVDHLADDSEGSGTSASSSRRSTISSDCALSSRSAQSSLDLHAMYPSLTSITEDSATTSSYGSQLAVRQQELAQLEPSPSRLASCDLDSRASMITHPDSNYYEPRGDGPKTRATDPTTGLSVPTGELELLLLHCDLVGFMRRHYGGTNESHRLGSVISLTGSIRHAYATTAEDYIRQHPKLMGPSLLDALQSAIDDEEHKFQASIQGVRLDIDLHIPEKAIIRVTGPQSSITQISYQLEWIGCTFQFSNGNGIEYSNTVKDPQHPNILDFRLDPVPENETSCWLPLFTNAVIAQRSSQKFPTPPRNNKEDGLEISFEIMVALAGVQSLVEFEGGTILKAFSSMLIPTHKHDDSVQWHYLQNQGKDLLWFNKAQGMPSVSVDKVEMRKRAFLGWCGKAEISLGTSNMDYGAITYTNAVEVSASWLRISTFTPSIQLLAGYIGVSVAANFELGTRDHNIHYPRSETFKDVIRQAEITPVVLYDLPEKRGWLVPASDVILHTLHKRFAAKQSTDLIYANPVRDGLAAASIALKESTAASNQSAVSSWEEVLFEIWDTFEVCRMNLVKKDIGSNISIPGAKELRGWEYMDMVEQNPEIRQKRAVVQKTNGGWVNLTQDINCLVFIAARLGDIIKPAFGSDYCQRWPKLPVGKGYLAAPSSILQKLYDRAGSSSDYQYLTTKSDSIQWHVPRESKIFEKCERVTDRPCVCNRLQELVKKSPVNKCFRTISLPKKLEAEGAVMFGIPSNEAPTSSRTSTLSIYNDVVTPISPSSNATSCEQVSMNNKKMSIDISDYNHILQGNDVTQISNRSQGRFLPSWRGRRQLTDIEMGNQDTKDGDRSIPPSASVPVFDESLCESFPESPPTPVSAQAFNGDPEEIMIRMTSTAPSEHGQAAENLDDTPPPRGSGKTFCVSSPASKYSGGTARQSLSHYQRAE